MSLLGAGLGLIRESGLVIQRHNHVGAYPHLPTHPHLPTPPPPPLPCTAHLHPPGCCPAALRPHCWRPQRAA